MYDPTNRYRPTWSTFRTFGPLHRFDHQRPMRNGDPKDDLRRGIYYAAFDLEGAIVEVFGDPPYVIARKVHRVVRVRLNQPLELLDLRGPGAMAAGTTAAVTAVPDHRQSQPWARYIYDKPTIYGRVDGILYANSHNALDAIALFERAGRAVRTGTRLIRKLSGAAFDDELTRIAYRNNLILEP